MNSRFAPASPPASSSRSGRRTDKRPSRQPGLLSGLGSTRARRLLSGLLVSTALAGCSATEVVTGEIFSSSETRIVYDVALEGAPDGDIEDLLEQALAVYREQERGAQSLAFLRRRAESDIPLAQKVLRSFGYYEAQVTVSVVPPTEEERSAQVAIQIAPGRAFTLASHQFEVSTTGAAADLSPLDAATLGSPLGATAEARLILDAEAAAIANLRGQGFVYAEKAGRESFADPDAGALTVVTQINAGRRYTIDRVAFEGLASVEEAYLLTYAPFKPGALYNAAELTDFQRSLARTSLFDGVSVRPPETPPPGDTAPVLVRVEEGDHRTLSAGVRYDTDIGPAVRAGFQHRNLFGRNEITTLEAETALNEQFFDATYRAPQYLRPGQDLVGRLDVRRIEDEAFDEVGATTALGLERRLSPALTVGAGGLAEISSTNDDGVDGASLLGGVPVYAAYDDSDDRLNPTRGKRIRLGATPFAGDFDGDRVAFLNMNATASSYLDLTSSKRYILAGRARLGSILVASLDDVPAQRRLYSGGGGSVRGYRERFVGPLDDDGDPDGGLSVMELGAELRLLATETIGVAGFVEAGAITQSFAPGLQEDIQSAAGGGVRYLSPVGPFRVDVGVPIDRRPEDDPFQVYISLGQAF